MEEYYFDKYYRLEERESLPSMMFLYWEFVKHSLEYADANVSSRELNLSLLPNGREFQADFMHAFPTRTRTKEGADGAMEEEVIEETPESIGAPFAQLFKVYPTVNLMLCLRALNVASACNTEAHIDVRICALYGLIWAADRMLEGHYNASALSYTEHTFNYILAAVVPLAALPEAIEEDLSAEIAHLQYQERNFALECVSMMLRCGEHLTRPLVLPETFFDNVTANKTQYPATCLKSLFKTLISSRHFPRADAANFVRSMMRGAIMAVADAEKEKWHRDHEESLDFDSLPNQMDRELVRTHALLSNFELLAANVELLKSEDYWGGFEKLIAQAKENLTNPLSSLLREKCALVYGRLTEDYAYLMQVSAQYPHRHEILKVVAPIFAQPPRPLKALQPGRVEGGILPHYASSAQQPQQAQSAPSNSFKSKLRNAKKSTPTQPTPTIDLSIYVCAMSPAFVDCLREILRRKDPFCDILCAFYGDAGCVFAQYLIPKEILYQILLLLKAVMEESAGEMSMLSEIQLSYFNQITDVIFQKKDYCISEEPLGDVLLSCLPVLCEAVDSIGSYEVLTGLTEVMTNYIKKGGAKLIKWKDMITQCFVKVAERAPHMRRGARGEYLTSIALYGLGLFLGNLHKVDETVEIVSIARDVVRLATPLFERAAAWVEEEPLAMAPPSSSAPRFDGAVVPRRLQARTIAERRLFDAMEPDQALMWNVLCNALYALSRVLMFVDDDEHVQPKLIDVRAVCRYYSVLPLAVIPDIIDFQNFVCQSVNSQMMWLWINGGLTKHLEQCPGLFAELQRIYDEVAVAEQLVQQYVHDQMSRLEEEGMLVIEKEREERMELEAAKQKDLKRTQEHATNGASAAMEAEDDQWADAAEDRENRTPAKKSKTAQSTAVPTPRRSPRNRKSSS